MISTYFKSVIGGNPLKASIIYQLIGFGALITLGLSFYQKDKKRIMFWQIAAFVIFCTHYALIGARSGALCNLVQIATLILFCLRDRYGWKKAYIAVPILLGYAVIAVVTYESPVSLLSVAASIIGMAPFFQSNKNVIRGAGIASDAVWLGYAIFVRSYSAIITNIVLIAVTFVSFFERHKKNAGQAEEPDIK